MVFDCYRDFSEKERNSLTKAFLNEVKKRKVVSENVDFVQFRKMVYLTAIQRLYKCVGIFSRLYLRDGKKGYLQYIPRVIYNIKMICSMYPSLSGLSDLFTKYERHNVDFASMVDECSTFNPANLKR